MIGPRKGWYMMMRKFNSSQPVRRVAPRAFDHLKSSGYGVPTVMFSSGAHVTLPFFEAASFKGLLRRLNKCSCLIGLFKTTREFHTSSLNPE
jgi:hypothetical protein